MEPSDTARRSPSITGADHTDLKPAQSAAKVALQFCPVLGFFLMQKAVSSLLSESVLPVPEVRETLLRDGEEC